MWVLITKNRYIDLEPMAYLILDDFFDDGRGHLFRSVRRHFHFFAFLVTTLHLRCSVSSRLFSRLSLIYMLFLHDFISISCFIWNDSTFLFWVIARAQKLRQSAVRRWHHTGRGDSAKLGKLGNVVWIHKITLKFSIFFSQRARKSLIILENFKFFEAVRAQRLSSR